MPGVRPPVARESHVGEQYCIIYIYVFFSFKAVYVYVIIYTKKEFILQVGIFNRHASEAKRSGGTVFIHVCLCVCLSVSALTFEWFHFSSPNFQRIFI